MNRHLYFIYIFVSFMYIFCVHGAYRGGVLESEIIKENLSTKSEDQNLSGFEILAQVLGEQPSGILVELAPNVLQNIKNNWEEFSQKMLKKQILLATYDSKGLQDRILYNDTYRFLQRINNLKLSKEGIINSTPTMQVIQDLVKENLSRGVLVLLTATKPSDENLSEIVAEALINKRIQLSVFWMGSESITDYMELKNLAIRSGGVFEIISDQKDRTQMVLQNLLSENINISGRFKFPEEHSEYKDEEGVLTVRAANQKLPQKAFVPVIVEVASGTNLEMRPGTAAQIPFYIKNNLNTPLPMFFRATFNGVLQNVQPSRTELQPQASITVNVNIQPFPSAQSNALGTVTFSVNAANMITSRSALISYTSQNTNDYTPPKLQYKYDGDCSNYKDPQNCEKGYWGFEATVHDEESGLLKILSEPYGLIFQSEFVAGTKSPTTVYYSANCCQSKVDIWAEDLRGNHVKKTLDVFNQNLYAGEIAAIVLGVLLLLFLIVGVIVAVILIKRRNRRNMIIPRHSSGSR